MRFSFRRLVALSPLFLLFSTAEAQIAKLPPSVPFEVLGNDTVRVLFPKGFEHHARRTAATVMELRLKRVKSLRESQIKGIDIVLQPYTTIPNAYVQLAPKRSEFFLTPMQDALILGSGNWPDLLAIHEYRHVQQFYNAKAGGTALSYGLFGEFGWLVSSFLTTPNWFWEGDAVVYETALTPGGRGRYPSFFMEYRAFANEMVEVSYDQARLGSFVNYSPGHYPLGYMMNVYVRNKHGQTIWNDIFRDAVTWKKPVLSFSRSLKQRTGRNASQTFTLTRSYFSEWWRSQDAADGNPTGGMLLTQKSYKDILEYRFVHPEGTNEVIALKKSFDETERVVLRRGYFEQELAAPGLAVNPWLSVNAGWLAWTELRNDPRWSGIDYSVIVLKNRSSGKSVIIGKKDKLFSPVLHPVRTGELAALRIPASGNPELVFADAAKAGISAAHTLEHIDFASHPAWDGDAVIFVGRKGHKNALLRRNADGTMEELTPWTAHPIAYPKASDSLIVFVSTFHQKDEVYAVSRTGQRLYRLTVSQNGASTPVIAGGNLYWSDFSTRGYQLKMVPLSGLAWKPVVIVEPAEQKNPVNEITAFEGGDITANIPVATFTAAPYDPARKLLNVHSWAPYFESIGPTYNLMLFNENLLSTLYGVGTLGWNSNISAASISGDLFYSRYFPVIHAFTSLYDFSEYRNNQDQTKALRAGAGVRLPLQKLAGNHIGMLDVSADVMVIDSDFRSPRVNRAEEKPFAATEFSIAASTMRRTALRQPYGQNGVAFELNLFRSLKDDVPVNTFSGDMRVFLPGAESTHNTVFSGGFWREKRGNLHRFDNTFRLPRGYLLPDADELYRLSANYTLPLSYFHKNFGALAYSNRMRANVFYDYGFAENGMWTPEEEGGAVAFGRREMRSAGVEIIFDTYLFRLVPIEFVIQAIERIDDDGYKAKAGSVLTFNIGVRF
jgi:hypothetical protein